VAQKQRWSSIFERHVASKQSQSGIFERQVAQKHVFLEFSRVFAYSARICVFSSTGPPKDVALPKLPNLAGPRCKLVYRPVGTRAYPCTKQSGTELCVTECHRAQLLRTAFSNAVFDRQVVQKLCPSDTDERQVAQKQCPTSATIQSKTTIHKMCK
jgi:hypothetical protein